MTDDPKTPQKEDPTHLVGWTKSYTVDGDTTEFNARELQIHEFSPELRAQLSHVKLARLDPKYLQDIILPNREEVRAPSECASEPSIPEPAVAPVAEPPSRTKRGKPGWPAAALAFALVGGAVLFWFGAREVPHPARVGKTVASASPTTEKRELLELPPRPVQSAAEDGAPALGSSGVQSSSNPSAPTKPPAEPKSNASPRRAKPEGNGQSFVQKLQPSDARDAPVVAAEPAPAPSETPHPAALPPLPKPTATATQSSPQLIFQPQ